MARQEQNIIELRKVSKVYEGPIDTPVLFDIDLEIIKGSLNSIIGQSGSGKSTLLNMLGNLDYPTTGEVLVNNQFSHNMKPEELAILRNNTMGFVFQFHYLLPEYSVIENVLMPKNIQRKGKITQEDRQKARELLELVGLADKMDSQSGKISGGQQQRTAIARALMNEPEVVLADEPTGNLDSDTSREIHKLFCKINLEHKTTFIVVTHDERIAQQTNRIIELKDGRIISDKINSSGVCPN